MMRRDGTGRPWVGKEEQLTQVERKSREIIDAAGLPKELTFTSFGRHGGATKSMTSGLTELELMKKGQWSSPKAMVKYLHGDDEGKQMAQLNASRSEARAPDHSPRLNAASAERSVANRPRKFVGTTQPALSE